MKKIHVIAKTHLDLGFTDYAENIEKLYYDTFIPKAIALAKDLNADKKRFIWTTGSWIIANALQKSSEANRKELEKALRSGDIKPHGLPFTTHTELLDEDTFRYGLDIAQNLKEEYGFSISAAKMTDVPGHTKAIVPLLADYGIKLLHIGVNDSSAMPKTPQAFLWQYQGKEIIVIYEGSYGSLYKNELIDDILYFAHSADNNGPNGKQNMIEVYEKLQSSYPDYEVVASTLDDYAEEIWKVKNNLPILTSEIGDSWIHGAATDPYKAAAIKELIRLKNDWLKTNELSRTSEGYKNLANYILMLSEHTWGMDVKKHLSDLGVYLKDDFKRARKEDDVYLNYHQPFALEWKEITEKMRQRAIYCKGSYKKIEKSWKEQREYINKALEKLPMQLKDTAMLRLQKLIPSQGFDKSGFKSADLRKFQIDKSIIEFNSYGALKNLIIEELPIIQNNDNTLVDYKSYGASDYDFWLENYSRNMEKHREWAEPDFGRPLLNHYEGKYLQGVFGYKMVELLEKRQSNEALFLVRLVIDKRVSSNLGAPEFIEVLYTINTKKGKFKQQIIWRNKEASRLTEAIFLHFNLCLKEASLKYKKLGKEVNPLDVVENGNRNISAVEEVLFDIGNQKYCIKNYHSPLVSLGKGKILRFDNIYLNPYTEGLSFILYNNVWGTNFPLWYSENAYFAFEIQKIVE